MNLIELNRSLVQLRLSGMAAVMETRLLQAQSESMAPIDLISMLVSDELACRSNRLLDRRNKQAQFRDASKLLDSFDFQFNPKMNRSLVFDLATANWVGKREDALFLGPPGSGKSHCAQAIGHAVIQQGYRVLYREAHRLLEELADATLDGKRKELMEQLTTVPLLIIDDLGMRKLPLTAAEELLEIIMRRYERASTLLTSNRPVEDWGKLLGDSAAVTAMLDRLLHHGHVLKCGPRSWRTKTGSTGDAHKSKSKDKCNKECRAKNARRRRDSRSRGLPRRSLTIGISIETRNPPPQGPSGKPQRVSITDSFGASPVSSALDHSAGRDPGRATTTLTRNQRVRSSTRHSLPCKFTRRQGKTITSSATLYGRF
jgi:DNA replication protein DnaC